MADDYEVLRKLAGRYMEIADDPVMTERRELWRRYMSMESTRPPISIGFGAWSAFMDDFLNLPEHRECEEQTHYKVERDLKLRIYKSELGDDTVFKPYYTIRAVTLPRTDEELMGVRFKKTGSYGIGHGYHIDSVIETLTQAKALDPGTFEIDEEATAACVDDLSKAFEGVLEIDEMRGPFLTGFSGDCSYHYMNLRGLEQMMTDPYLEPEIHGTIMEFLKRRTLADHRLAEEEGRVSSSAFIEIQGEGYTNELPDPQPNTYSGSLKDCWFFAASQELTAVGPDFFEKHMVDYQLPIVEQFGLVHYGCCENLSDKIDVLRKIPNLRRIAVTPSADIDCCVEEIGTDYLISWRPNPGLSVTVAYDVEATRKFLVENLRKLEGCMFDVSWKDIENDCGDPYNLRNSIVATKKAFDDLGLM